MSALLSLHELSAGYDKKTIVHDISFEIFAGEFCVLLGRNGSGKTTLLKAICGLLPVLSGRCLIEGLDYTHFNEYRRAKHISYIPQQYSKMQGVTVLDAVLMGLNARLGVLAFPSASDKVLALDTLNKFGFGYLTEKDFSLLSEGEKQIVILARTIMQDTPVMLMDEPDSSLDFVNRHQMLKKLRRIIHSENKAGLITLHDPNLALAYCDRVIILHDGVIDSDISLSQIERDDIQRSFSKVYGNVSLLEHDGRYILLAPGGNKDELQPKRRR